MSGSLFMSSLGGDYSDEEDDYSEEEMHSDNEQTNHVLDKESILITPSHTPFELTKQNISVPIDTIHPSWRSSVINKSFEQQKIEQWKKESTAKHCKIINGKKVEIARVGPPSSDTNESSEKKEQNVRKEVEKHIKSNLKGRKQKIQKKTNYRQHLKKMPFKKLSEFTSKKIVFEKKTTDD